MPNFIETIDFIEKTSDSIVEKGRRFELLIKNYLLTDPQYSFSDVFLWREWENRPQHVDTGIDIVAKTHDLGEFWAIQCKFYAEDTVLTKKSIDSFFTASGQSFTVNGEIYHFNQRIIVATTENWSLHAKAAITNQNIPVLYIGFSDLENSPVDWNALLNQVTGQRALVKKSLRPHQETAIQDVAKGLQSADRGKLIMACGTGKTFTSLKIAEKMLPDHGIVLFLVPSIALLSQSLREWTAESERDLHFVAVCSDGKASQLDAEDIRVTDLSFPATTDIEKIKNYMERFKKSALSSRAFFVIFSTYQSIDVVSAWQKETLITFDLVICDEAHRTTGVTLAKNDESHFVKVHENKFIQAKKRLYMTATPRLFTDTAKKKAEENDAILCSMDDPAIYGENLHKLGFSTAVEKGLLSDYKVLVLAVPEDYVKQFGQQNLNSELSVEDKAKIIGFWNGLAKKFHGENNDDDLPYMRRAVAFAGRIKDSESMVKNFASVVQEYKQNNPDEIDLICAAEHVDGKMGIAARNSHLRWLKDEPKNLECRILSNARCLSEGVDVPALDAVIFLNPRNSKIDVVQSVGRVMRKSPNKKYGYVILPVVIPSQMSPEEALDKNEAFKVVWDVLQALRAHDDRFQAMINKIELNRAIPDNLSFNVIGQEIAEESAPYGANSSQFAINFDVTSWKNALFAKLVLKCGERRYWEDWAKDIADIAERHIKRLNDLLKSGIYQVAFSEFLTGLQQQINPSIQQHEAIEMLAQHLITKPVFDALFENYEFTQKNPVSQAMQKMLSILEEQTLEEERKTLEKFYDSVRKRASGIDNSAGKQRVIIELYDKFFKSAFPRLSERLGIVYTPVEVVDFIVQSAAVALQREFGKSLGDEGVHILDPFSGTGTFIVRLLQSGLIAKENLLRKYETELHANEIVLLAYYIAAVNIEEAFHELNQSDYLPFNGMVLTDTFQMYEKRDWVDVQVLPENNERVEKQKATPIQIIIGNPPYSVGQSSANDNNQNLAYFSLDNRITETYAKFSNATSIRNLYDAYIRAIRWASDRVKDKGIIAFVTNGSFIDTNSMAGLRKCLVDEFTNIYCFNLRGNIRKFNKAEGQNIFGQSSMTPIAITFFIKNPAKKGNCELFYHDIGDCLSQKEKLNIIMGFKNIDNVDWQKIKPNKSHDWINQRSDDFSTFISLGDKKNKAEKMFFNSYSLGIATGRDTWAYNFAKSNLANNMQRMIAFYNSQVDAYHAIPKNERPDVDQFIDFDAEKISWARGTKQSLQRNKPGIFNEACIIKSMYRPFCKQWLYFDRQFNEMIYQMSKIFPNPDTENLVICVPSLGARRDFSVFISNTLPDLHIFESGSQCFPLYIYEESTATEGLFSQNTSHWQRRDAINDDILRDYRAHYADSRIDKTAIFYYIYGVLHDSEYKTNYAADLKKMLPRIPYMPDFWQYSDNFVRIRIYRHKNFQN
jgi:predicted helicase